jgi:tripartite-type tricarboxylate transporter receptor subunit TctC
MRKALVFVVFVLLFGAYPAQAVDFPTKPISLVVPFAAGGPTDAVARVLARPLGAALKGQVIVENIVGAGGTVAAARVAKAAPDGHTLFIHHIGHSTAVSLYRRLPYDPIRDFEPIGFIGDIPMTLIGKKDFPARNLRELIAHVKAHSAKINLAHAGIGSASHLCGILFQSAIETDLTTVPYGGTGPAMMALLGGQVDLMCDQSVNTIPQIKAGSVSTFGVTTRTRVPALADVPTLHEAGLPNFEVSVWNALYAPRGTSKAIIDKINKALIEALRDPVLRQRFAELGMELFPEARINPDALRAHLKAEIDKWGVVIKKAGVFAD